MLMKCTGDVCNNLLLGKIIVKINSLYFLVLSYDLITPIAVRVMVAVMTRRGRQPCPPTPAADATYCSNSPGARTFIY